MTSGASCKFPESSPEARPAPKDVHETDSNSEEPISNIRKGKRPAHFLTEASSPVQKVSGPRKIKNLRSILAEKSTNSTPALDDALKRVEKLEEKLEKSLDKVNKSVAQFDRLLKVLNLMLEEA